MAQVSSRCHGERSCCWLLFTRVITLIILNTVFLPRSSSFDVLASTASILNLCVISLDRYWAITDPISYPTKMTSKRALILICAVWTCSSLISFPAIIWWRAVSSPSPPAYRCLFTDDISYLLVSSTISFYGPLAVMLVVYYRIYRAAVEQTRSIRLGELSSQLAHTIHIIAAS